jgi:tetratricopeptide (TPR) repeat protein
MVKKYGIILLVLPLMAACSSAPQRPAEIFSIQSMIETQIGRANKEADEGNYTESLYLLGEAWRLAVMTDRPALRIRVNLARANALYALDRLAEAEKVWRDAEIEAEFSGEPLLASASRVYRARSTMISGRANPEEVLALMDKEQENLKSDKLLAAMGWTVRGLAEKELGLYGEAEKSIRNALSTHDKGRYLEQAAYDWYLIASIRSIAGNYREALEALNLAVGFDRRAENSFGLAMDWAAIGDIFRKMDLEEAAAISWHRSAEIFRAMDKAAQAREVESRIKSRRQDPGTKNKSQ